MVADFTDAYMRHVDELIFEVITSSSILTSKLFLEREWNPEF